MKEKIRIEDFKINSEVSKFWAQMILEKYWVIKHYQSIAYLLSSISLW